MIKKFLTIALIASVAVASAQQRVDTNYFKKIRKHYSDPGTTYVARPVILLKFKQL